MNEINLQFLGFGLRPPPFIDLLFQADIENISASPVWFLFPLYLDQPAQFGRFLASAVEIFELPGKGQLRIARFLGDCSFQAMRLSPSARVRIHDLPITLIGEPPKTEITVPVILAGNLSIGDQRAEDWFQLDLTSSREAEVTEEPGAIVASQDTPGAKPVPVTLSDERTMRFSIPLKKT